MVTVMEDINALAYTHDLLTIVGLIEEGTRCTNQLTVDYKHHCIVFTQQPVICLFRDNNQAKSGYCFWLPYRHFAPGPGNRKGVWDGR